MTTSDTPTSQGQQPAPTPIKRCGSCGAPVHQEPAEGEGLPCGH
ncbi:hypothetical protein [Comamonas aquatica]|jgi:hypothetical protein|nr:hypothetical protein [Comamonas aquatica]